MIVMCGLFNKVCTPNLFSVEKSFKKWKFYFCFIKKYNEWFIHHVFTLFHFQIFLNHFTSFVATLTLGLWPRQKGLKGAGQEECENEDSHSQMSFPFGSWSPGGLPNFQRAIAEVKTPRIDEFFISLKIYWSLDV